MLLFFPLKRFAILEPRCRRGKIKLGILTIPVVAVAQGPVSVVVVVVVTYEYYLVIRCRPNIKHAPRSSRLKAKSR